MFFTCLIPSCFVIHWWNGNCTFIQRLHHISFQYFLVPRATVLSVISWHLFFLLLTDEKNPKSIFPIWSTDSLVLVPNFSQGARISVDLCLHMLSALFVVFKNKLYQHERDRTFTAVSQTLVVLMFLYHFFWVSVVFRSLAKVANCAYNILSFVFFLRRPYIQYNKRGEASVWLIIFYVHLIR